MTTKKPITFDKCPECGEPLEATAKIYLSFVTVNQHGGLENYSIAFGGNTAQAIDFDDPDTVDIYCPNDHPFELNVAKKKRKGKRK